jgi:hypothetical protein
MSLQVFSQCEADGWFGIPDELYRNRYQVPDMTYGNPYTIFDRRQPGGKYINLNIEIQKIRDRIIADKSTSNSPDSGKVYSAYQALYNNANVSTQPDEAGTSELSKLV